MGPGGEKGRSGRRRGMGVESGRSAFPGGHANRRFVSCPGTPGGGSPPTVSRRCTGVGALEDGGGKQTRWGADRKFGRVPARAGALASRFSRESPAASEVYPTEQTTDALSRSS